MRLQQGPRDVIIVGIAVVECQRDATSQCLAAVQRIGQLPEPDCPGVAIYDLKMFLEIIG